jgi:NAD(P)H-hydrate epimerase
LPYNQPVTKDDEDGIVKQDVQSLYSAAGVRELDRVAIEDCGVGGLALMRRAARACVEVLLQRWPGCESVCVFCGSGNNAGDGYIVAGMLAEKKMDVTVQVVGDTSKLGQDATEAHRYCLDSGATMVPFDAGSNPDCDVIVDGLLGTGLAGGVRSNYLAAIDTINDSACPVLAIDIPSGLSADTGVILGGAVKADATVTFIGMKQGLLTLDGPDHAGEIYFDDLNVPPEIYDEVEPSVRLLNIAEQMAPLPPRPRNAHKNKFGHVLVVGGDAGMGGAVAMSAEAALRVGAGLVSVATNPLHVNAILARRPELMVMGVSSPDEVLPLLARASLVVLGPGLGRSDWSNRLFKLVMQETLATELPMVLDADGLNLLALTPERRDTWVLTPHPGEASNLLQDNRIQSDRFAAVTALQEKFGGTALLKGIGTVIYDGAAMSLCSHGNPGMSTAGMGDVLSGVIGGLCAQGMSAGDATRLGVLVHAIAGDICAEDLGERGIAASDLVDEIRGLLNARYED